MILDLILWRQSQDFNCKEKEWCSLLDHFEICHVIENFLFYTSIYHMFFLACWATLAHHIKYSMDGEEDEDNVWGYVGDDKVNRNAGNHCHDDLMVV